MGDERSAEGRADEAARRARLIEAEDRALALLDLIEAEGLIRPGRSEREVEADIRALAAQRFGIERHWHRRICRAGANTLATALDDVPGRTIGADDMVFLDLGPVLGEWEADVGRSYAVGGDPVKQALCRELPVQFERLAHRFREDRGISGAELFAFAVESAREAGWLFGGMIAGHIVGEFPHKSWPEPVATSRIWPDNPQRLREPDLQGRTRHWIGEIHLVAPDRSFGGFYERLLRDDPA
jgi:Xaa-Pro aminopeptidase